ncbi:hypothetical protein VP01_1639g18 [Puccinia sorghi]|uniref:Uncharacterized protein n=1 Tax=Puccinia sorghi TaxID=27349 RepID=A0A0L6VGQ7_9BASI|nr:hypothetical protein VP01_1639g18 [Puccinia sorghi]
MSSPSVETGSPKIEWALSGGSNTASAAKESNICDYIKLIGLQNPKVVLEILESNDMLSHKIFESSKFERLLYNYVSKYERHLAKTKMAANAASMSNGA